MLYADVILPVPIPGYFTYLVPPDVESVIKVGARVVVQFGKKKILTAIVARLHPQMPHYETKVILELLDFEPLISKSQLALFQWIADYYMCTVGEVMNVAIPSGMKLGSESRIQLHPRFLIQHEGKNFAEAEKKLIEILQKEESITFDQAVQITAVKNMAKLLKRLVEKEIIIVFEQVKEKYKPKIVKKIRLNPSIAAEKSKIEQVIKLLEKQPKQLDILLAYLRTVPVVAMPTQNEKGVLKSAFLTEYLSSSSLQTLIKNQIFEEFEEIVSRLEEWENPHLHVPKEVKLTELQENAVSEIMQHFQDKNVVLLHGITGSGKTEVYIHLIQQTLASGSQVLLLLPEIALTTQIVARLQRVFGNTMGVYHSKFSDNERVEVWQGIAQGKFQFVVGVRSAIFLPFDNLGLIIVDEEHEGSYKQHDPAPRYHARDCAIWLAHQHQGKVLLGSATPSIDTYFQAKSGKWGLVEMLQRFGEAQLPLIQTIDLKKAKRNKQMKKEFAELMLLQIQTTLDAKKQVILFQNRRGYAPYITCQDCGWTPYCTNCDVALTHHQAAKTLNCHYCGYQQKMLYTCPNCGSHKVQGIGYGTEKIEDELQQLLQGAVIQRMDLDTTRSKGSYQRIIEGFASGQTNVLVGTQMISKGLDFDNVTLVGIFDIDRSLHYPDFRSHERVFQLLTQVAGRAGRRSEQGTVLIQTNQPEHPVIQFIQRSDYISFYELEIKERENYHYPPFYRLIVITLKHEDADITQQAAHFLYQKLAEKLSIQRVFGPNEPLVSRIRNKYLMQIMIKLEREKVNLKATKQFIQEAILATYRQKNFGTVHIIPDVDPM